MNNLLDAYKQALESNLDLSDGLEDEIIIRDNAVQAMKELEGQNYLAALEYANKCRAAEFKYFRDGPWREFFRQMLFYIWETYMEENYLERQENSEA